MNFLRRLAVLACSLAGLPAWADPPAAPFWASAAVMHRALEEEAANGSRLLRETGPLLELRLGARQPLRSGGVLAGELSLAGGPLAYDGQTQGGIPLQTDADHRDLGARLMWRPVPAQAWGEPWLLAGWHQNRRAIAGRGNVSGLRETSSAWLLGARWRSPVHQASPGWQLQLEAEAQVSARHRLDVDFHGLFDQARLTGGRQRRTAVRLVATPVHAPWEWTLEWSRLNQAVSPASPLLRAGLVAGSVRQPRLSIDDVALRVTRRF